MDYSLMDYSLMDEHVNLIHFLYRTCGAKYLGNKVWLSCIGTFTTKNSNKNNIINNNQHNKEIKLSNERSSFKTTTTIITRTRHNIRIFII